MPLVLEAEPVSLAVDADGIYRVTGTRVTLDTVVTAYQEGATPEEIADQYPSLKLDHIYAVISYYSRHREEVAAYLGDRAKCAAKPRAATEKHGLHTAFATD